MNMDRVCDVAALAAVETKAAPDFGEGWDARCLRRLGMGNRMRILLDIEQIVTTGALAWCHDPGCQ